MYPFCQFCKMNNSVFQTLRKLSTARVNFNMTSEQVKQTHFGFQTIKEEDKSKKVGEVFESVAEKYDLMNDAMSLGIHRVWKDIFIQRLGPTPNTKLLDVAGGTGDIAFRFLKYLQNISKFNNQDKSDGSVTITDINEAMLDVSKLRAKTQGFKEPEVNWLLADAENLPIEDSMYSAYTIAFGIRNVTHIDKALHEAYRVLQPGGRFLCLEFSHVDNDLLHWVYDQYSFQLIPVMGQLLAGDWKSYQYLVESIRQFPNQEDFKKMIQMAGFKYCSYENLTFGVVAIHSGFKL
uniref:2-methoxy-6-polyprenyl-1,4-benzoquinol methylase, mitochondrial n=1 Tax=Clastoptera arizonana TaxID=38151 RepID=A0A1B6CR76_9HEMI